MTKVVFYERDDKLMTGFEAAGHAGYAKRGQDIVCAAVSALTQAAANGLSEVVKANLEARMDEDTGYLSCMLTNANSEDVIEKSQILLKTLKMALTEISKDYPGTIRIIIRERR